MSRKRLLFVVGAGGPPLEYALPRFDKHAAVYALTFIPPTDRQAGVLREWCREVSVCELSPGEQGATDAIEREARRIKANGIIGLSEFTVVAVAQACLRLGLPGPGPNARYARDKWLMRTRWAEAGLVVPKFRKVAGLDDLETAARELRKPFLLKPSGRGGGIGQQIITDDTSLPAAWANLSTAVAQAASSGIVEYSDDFDTTHCVAEEIIESTIESWYDRPGYGDFLSVEGIVSGGVYHPLCINARLPAIPPFAETGAISPCVLLEPMQRKIEDCARRAVTALGLETCATHTEMKLMAENQLCVIETAARVGGSMAVALSEAVFGVDLVGLQAAEALGEPQDYPERMLVTGDGAASSIFLFAADIQGNPWSAQPRLWWETLDWSGLVSPGTQVEVVWSQMIPNGNPMPAYHPGKGALSYAGAVFARSSDPVTMLADANRLINGLEAAACEEDERVQQQPPEGAGQR